MLEAWVEQRMFGRRGVRLPAVGMGTWRTFDVRSNQVIAMRDQIVAEALASGVTVIDSSPMFSAAEAVLTHARRGRHDEAVVATKIWASSLREGRRPIDRALGLIGDRIDIRSACAGSTVAGEPGTGKRNRARARLIELCGCRRRHDAQLLHQ